MAAKPVAAATMPTTTVRHPVIKTRHRELEKKGVWSSLLESVSSGKRLDEKSLVILGGGKDAQRRLLEHISQPTTTSQRRNYRDRGRQQRKPPVANDLALGFTYVDITGDDQDDLLCRLSVHMLPEAHPAFTPLLTPLFTPSTIPETLAVIMLDWNEPWDWMSQLRDRVRMLRTVLDATDVQCQEVMDENMQAWRERRKGPMAEDGSSKVSTSLTPVILGPGEWDMPLGVPICVVCHNAEKIRHMETEYGWKDKEFDNLMQHLRAVLLRHGGSLIYVSDSDYGSLRPLIRSSLGIKSMTRNTALKRNVTDRDHVLIPPNWDSWGNIRAQMDTFDPEKVSKAWAMDVELKIQNEALPATLQSSENEETAQKEKNSTSIDPSGAVSLFHQSINRKRYPPPTSPFTTGIKIRPPVITCPDYQPYLAEQAKRLAKLKEIDEAAKQARLARRRRNQAYTEQNDGQTISQALGDVQFNAGGIQVNMEAAIEELHERAAERAQERLAGVVEEEAEKRVDEGEREMTREETRAFFSSLVVNPRTAS